MRDDVHLLVGMCCYNPFSLSQKAIEAVRKRTDVPFTLVLVYNYPPYNDGAFEVYQDLAYDDRRVKLIDPGKNLGCHGGINAAWEFGELCSQLRTIRPITHYAKVDDDTIVPPNWASMLIEGLEAEPRLAFISSDITARSRAATHRGKIHQYPNCVQVEELAWVSFSAMIAPASTYEDFGPLTGTGVYGGEEHAWCDLARERGYMTGYRLGVMSFHADVHSRPLYSMFKVVYAMRGWRKCTFEEMYRSPKMIAEAYQLYVDYYKAAREPCPLTPAQIGLV